MTVWTPDQPTYTGKLTKAEQRWLEQQAEADTPGSTRVRRPHPFAEKMLTTAVNVTTGIRNATATIPPPKRSNAGSIRRTGPSDPTAAQVASTFHTVASSCSRLGHILDECAVCSDPMPPLSCNTNRDLTLAALTGQDYTELATTLAGAVTATAPRAVGKVTAEADVVFARAALTVVDVWDDMHRSGAESDRLRDYCGQIVEVTRRLSALSGVLAQWIPGGVVRVCKNRDCRRPAPPLPEGAVERGGAQCRPCIDAQYRARLESA